MQQGQLKQVANGNLSRPFSGRSTDRAVNGTGTFPQYARGIRRRPFWDATSARDAKYGGSVQKFNVSRQPAVPPHRCPRVAAPPPLPGFTLSLTGKFPARVPDPAATSSNANDVTWAGRKPCHSGVPGCCAAPRFDKTYPLPLLL